MKLYTKNQSLLEKANKKLRKETKLRKDAEEKINELKHEIKVLRGELDIASRKVILLTGGSKLKDKKKLIKIVDGLGVNQDQSDDRTA